MSELKIGCCPLEGGGVIFHLSCGQNEIEIHFDEPCAVSVLKDFEESEMECEEYTPVKGTFPMLIGAEEINKAIKELQDSS